MSKNDEATSRESSTLIAECADNTPDDQQSASRRDQKCQQKNNQNCNQEAGEAAPLDGDDPQPSKTILSTKLDRLKSATLKVVHARERLPQPLFWSLFHAEMDSIKRKRKKQREALATLYNIDWL